jgi:phosphoribosylamine--glycine ligase/phosphoribosylformylglycinamidine cyclo-ligase
MVILYRHKITEQMLIRRPGFPFIGVLFTGFMLTSTGPKVLEYNVRFGDPETEALMMLLDHNTDLAAVLLVSFSHVSLHHIHGLVQAAVEHRLDAVAISSKPGFAVSVILASGGYPGSYAKGKQIQIANVPEGMAKVLFFATLFDRNCCRCRRLSCRHDT